MAEGLRMGMKHTDEGIMKHIRAHLVFLNAHGHAFTGEAFAAQTRFFLEDEFHLRMLEDQQTGLAYYLSAAAGAYAAMGF
ncbi:TipAS antibiotic-recognition domain-containing protein [Paenibacillus sp. HB172176]|uniref:TipAS antibiotic-recognition domain-containing protein n=1 Tax=Paenibacillus sp. HB172176 TaxID=2493690 RepID=UPI00143A26ED